MASSAQASTSHTIAIASTAALGVFLFGFDTAVINGAVIALQRTFAAGDWEIGLSVSLTLLGAALGAFFAGQLSDILERISHGGRRVRPVGSARCSATPSAAAPWPSQVSPNGSRTSW